MRRADAYNEAFFIDGCYSRHNTEEYSPEVSNETTRRP